MSTLTLVVPTDAIWYFQQLTIGVRDLPPDLSVSDLVKILETVPEKDQ